MQSYSSNEEEGLQFVNGSDQQQPPQQLPVQPQVQLPMVASLGLPFEIEELNLPSATSECHFSEEQMVEIEAKTVELHREFFDFVKRKYEIIQLRYASTEEQKDNGVQRQEMASLIENLDKKRSDLTEKWSEWLTDRLQIAMLKHKIMRKQRSGSRDEVQNMLDQQLMFEKDPQYLSIMQSQLTEEEKYEFTQRFDVFRNRMMADYRDFFEKTIHEFREKERKKAMMNGQGRTSQSSLN